MKKSFLYFLIILSFQNLFSQNKDIVAITKLNHDWLNLSVKKDTAAFSNIFADDFMLINPGGAKRTKQQVVNGILHQDIKSIKIDSMDVKIVTPDVGIVTCYTTFVITTDGKDEPGRTCYQDVYVKRKGGWYAISAHVTYFSSK